MDPQTREASSVEHLVGCVPLATGETLRIVDPRSVLVYVPQGHVWITEERIADDFVLRAGQWHRLARPGVAVVEAFAPTVLLLTAPEVSGFARELATAPRPAMPPARTVRRARRRRARIAGLAAFTRRSRLAWLRRLMLLAGHAG